MTDNVETTARRHNLNQIQKNILVGLINVDKPITMKSLRTRCSINKPEGLLKQEAWELVRKGLVITPMENHYAHNALKNAVHKEFFSMIPTKYLDEYREKQKKLKEKEKLEAEQKAEAEAKEAAIDMDTDIPELNIQVPAEIQSEDLEPDEEEIQLPGCNYDRKKINNFLDSVIHRVQAANNLLETELEINDFDIKIEALKKLGVIVGEEVEPLIADISNDLQRIQAMREALT